jgi:hypothetical protein
VDLLAREMYVRMRRRELETAAVAHRTARDCARRRARVAGPSPVLRLYARLWWASRPRAAAWIPGLFDPRSA